MHACLQHSRWIEQRIGQNTRRELLNMGNPSILKFNWMMIFLFNLENISCKFFPIPLYQYFPLPTFTISTVLGVPISVRKSRGKSVTPFRPKWKIKMSENIFCFNASFQLYWNKFWCPAISGTHHTQYIFFTEMEPYYIITNDTQMAKELIASTDNKFKRMLRSQ